MRKKIGQVSKLKLLNFSIINIKREKDKEKLMKPSRIGLNKNLTKK